ncbi:MAG TPA: hypothetical protein VFV63_01025, partial [Ilumatobacteraceae bacterium]|nr:hypothetical protein [Ilumatobacteraceae bacterium]
MRDPDAVGIRIVVAATGVVVALMLAGCAENEPETAVTLSPLAVDPVQPPPTFERAPDTTTTVPGIAADLEFAGLETFDELAFDKEVVIGRSVEDRPITVARRGVEGGTKVLV